MNERGRPERIGRSAGRNSRVWTARLSPHNGQTGMAQVAGTNGSIVVALVNGAGNAV